MKTYEPERKEPLPILTCLRCGRRWRPPKSKVDACPKCLSPHWWKDKAPVAGSKKKPNKKESGGGKA